MKSRPETKDESVRFDVDSMKEYDCWNNKKKELACRDSIPFFSTCDIWWCNLGKNIGFEEDGKGDDFRRPVLVIRKFNKYLFIGIPLTSVEKNDKFHYKLPKYREDGKDSFLILSQIKVVSVNRLIRRIKQVEQVTLDGVNERLFGLILEKTISPDKSGESRTGNPGLHGQYSKDNLESQVPSRKRGKR